MSILWITMVYNQKSHLIINKLSGIIFVVQTGIEPVAPSFLNLYGIIIKQS